MYEKKKVLTINGDKIKWITRTWGVDHLPAIQSESMEMHKKHVLPHSNNPPIDFSDTTFL